MSDWWLPDNSASKTPGTYTILETGDAKAVLHRPLGDQHPLGFRPSMHPLVHGNAFGKSVTLIDARTGRSRTKMNGQAEIELRPRMAIEGLLLSEDELEVTEARVQIQNQDDWLSPRSFHVERDPQGWPKNVSIHRFAEHVALAGNALISIGDFSVIQGGLSNFSISSKSGFHLYFEKPIPIDKLFSVHLRGLQVLMTLVTGSRCGIESLRFTNDQWNIGGVVPESPRWVDVRVRAPELNSAKINPAKMLFPASSLRWEEQAPRVMSLSNDWVYAVEQWALLLDGRFVWPVARFATAASAVEALDRILNPDEQYEPDHALIERVAKALKEASIPSKDRAKVKGALKRPRETSLEQRIRRLTLHAPEAMRQIIDEPQWNSRVARLRHVVSHGLRSSEEFSQDVRSVQCGAEILLHLLECVFLSHLGFDAEQIADIKRGHPNTSWRKSVVQECFHLFPEVPGQAAATKEGPSGSEGDGPPLAPA
ncbi:ApeA N-terminal domain 1-containing protein [Streptomyces zaomyceticus]|uniref:ApeA N-terminal domain 1-containing protein n=1 Tax=Streptomyces zaomyceticus TaxID=68286 RepID=UPI002E1BB717